MFTTASFSDDVIAVYRGWYALAEKDGGWERVKWVLINDLSLSPVDPLRCDTLSDVRRALERLLVIAPAGKSAERIEQSLFFIEQNPGEPVTKEAVIKRGIPWRPVQEAQLVRLKDQARNLRLRLIDTGQLSDESFRARYDRRSGKAGVAADLGVAGRAGLDRIGARFPRLSPAVFSTKETATSLPWSNMVTFEEGVIRLIANIGPLPDYSPGRQGFLAIHEICGHVLHFSQLLRSENLRATSAHLLCLSIHTYDSYFIEGIAQFISSLYAERVYPGPTLSHLDIKQCELFVAVRHRNLTELIEKRIEVREAVEFERSYLGGDKAKIAAYYEVVLKDVFFSCQTLVYYPSHQALLPALTLPDAELERFLGGLLGEHHSPVDLDRLVSMALS